MAKDTAPVSVFTPRTVASFERTTNAIVSRFAEPVRAVGLRALGFIDRIIGARLFGQTASAQGLAPQDAGTVAVDGYIYARPWYEAPRAAAAALRARPVAAATAPASLVEARPIELPAEAPPAPVAVEPAPAEVAAPISSLA